MVGVEAVETFEGFTVVGVEVVETFGSPWWAWRTRPGRPWWAWRHWRLLGFTMVGVEAVETFEGLTVVGVEYRD